MGLGHLLLGLVGVFGDEGHGAFGGVAPFGADLPLVVGLDQDGAGQAEQGCGVGEDPDDVGAALDFLVEPLEMA